MDGKTAVVGIGGLGLIAANFWNGNQRQAIGGTVWKGNNPQVAHKALLGLSGELLLVFLMYLGAGASDGLATAMVVVVITLWVLWAIAHYTGAGNANSNKAATAGPTA